MLNQRDCVLEGMGGDSLSFPYFNFNWLPDKHRGITVISWNLHQEETPQLPLLLTDVYIVELEGISFVRTPKAQRIPGDTHWHPHWLVHKALEGINLTSIKAERYFRLHNSAPLFHKWGNRDRFNEKEELNTSPRPVFFLKHHNWGLILVFLPNLWMLLKTHEQPVHGNILIYQTYKNSEVTPDDSASLPPTSLGTRYYDSFVPSLILLAIHWFNNQMILKYSVTSTTCKALGSAKWKTAIAKTVWERRLIYMKINHHQKCTGPVRNPRVTARRPISITQRMI